MNPTNRKWISQIVACSFLAMLPAGAYAQSKTIHGVVKDANGETIIGASVGQKGTKNATVTNLDGEFSISVPDNAVLEISYIGYNNQRVAVNGKSSLEIVMTEDVHKLNELVVVGYGVMKKKDLTGAVGSLAAKDMENSPVANIGQAIQGKIAGLQVVDAGKPGDNVTIKVRGMGSINNCDPLVVIDGVPTDLGINALNMADVERLDVLKDASATAIYGSRGANGVIMITTKKGKEGKGSLSLSANLAIQNATRTPKLLNASQYAALSNDMMNNSGNAANPAWADPSALGKGTDWVDELLRTGYMQNYTLSYSGGSDKAHYYVSGGMLDQTGIVRSVKYRRSPSSRTLTRRCCHGSRWLPTSPCLPTASSRAATTWAAHTRLCPSLPSRTRTANGQDLRATRFGTAACETQSDPPLPTIAAPRDIIFSATSRQRCRSRSGSS